MKTLNMATPTRFRASCVFCVQEVDTRAPGVHQFVQGWVKNRKEGGSNAVVFPMPFNVYACESCIDAQRHETPGQGKLFA